MKTKELITLWGAPETPRLTVKQISIRLPILVSAKISALCEMYSKKTKTDIIGDLLNSALEQLEKDFPKVAGEQIGEDEYTDVGIGSTFRKLTEQYLRELEKEIGIEEPMEYVVNISYGKES